MPEFPGSRKTRKSGSAGGAQVSNTITTPGPRGPEGPQGPPGEPGPQNLFIQETEPTETTPYAWFETDGGGNLITLWVNT